ncbi:bifunctional DNA primase/polymerase [Aquamicrobium soli]|uniref:Bifunctional DNA primase/polymerase n=1 Tax=Aquamicrobium soli TaxID=1811518 RepID=A0ABV7K5J1_9HYPH
MTDDPRNFARLYLSLGMAVLPVHAPVVLAGGTRCSCGKADCRQPGKHPVARLVPHGLKNASKDPTTVDGWFSAGRYNIGIATGSISGIVALDIDPRHAGDEALARLEEKYGQLPVTWRFLTGGGGEHILFRHPKDRKIANSAGALGRGIDLRGDGGYIVAPPSLHICGRSYAISVDHHLDEVPLSDLPSWLSELLGTPARRKDGAKARPRDWRAHVVRRYAEGARNDAIVRLAGHLLRARVDPRVCLSLLASWNKEHCAPPLDDEEVVVTVRSIAAREVARRGYRHAD